MCRAVYRLILCGFLSAFVIAAVAWSAPPAAIIDPKLAQADPDFAIQGEYTGKVQGKDGEKTLAAQVIALGDHKFRAVGYSGGLPGDGWDGKVIEEVEATAADGAVTFKGKHATGTIKDGAMTVTNADGKEIGQLKRVVRESPTLGAKPPTGAVVLFDGKDADQWVSAHGNKGKAQMTADGLLVQGANTKHKFGSHTLHVEFMLPYIPAARGQARGNSGCYLQGRYEVQVLDSFGLKGENNECGGIYEVSKPKVNMCFPPLQWQTYDIEFTQPEFDAKGKKTANARVTVKHNGVVVQDNTEVPHPTRASPLPEGSQPGFLHLQDHGNPVRYRNVWAVEK
ncbi:MAG: DUF1080 domain-containing protein [Planctomycetia bacterium]|nr:DUF1080 domain-containing protein [Planctomycetia bacterium]